MDCTEVRAQLDAYEDGELDAAGAKRVEEHLIGCPHCLHAEEQLSALRRGVRAHATYYAAPECLRERVARLAERRDRAPPRRAVTLRWWQLGAVLSGTAIASVLATFLVVSTVPIRAEDKLVSELVASHVRSLMQDHLLDVASTDQHTVKPWFAGKLDYSPPVQDLSVVGFPLLGARLDYVDGRPVAALVYQHRQHRVNVYVWPERGRASLHAHELRVDGYNALGWTNDGMVYWAVSDLNSAELAQLKGLLKQK